MKIFQKLYERGQKVLRIFQFSRVVVVRAFNPSTREAETAGSPRVRGQPGLPSEFQDRLPSYRETLSRKNKIKTPQTTKNTTGPPWPFVLLK